MSFLNNRLIDPQDVMVTIFVVIIVIRILDNPLNIFRTRLNKLEEHQGYICGDFDAHIRHQRVSNPALDIS